MHNYAAARVGVLGATGFVGREIMGLLARHSRVRVGFGTSESEAGARLEGVELVRLEDANLSGCDVVVSCLPHGESVFWVERARGLGCRAIDLSADLRVLADGCLLYTSDA